MTFHSYLEFNQLKEKTREKGKEMQPREVDMHDSVKTNI